MIEILVSEVGPRDGLQSISRVMPLDAKKAWIAAEAAAGVREIEVGSFVPPALLPQMADTPELVAFARTIPGLNVVALVPNAKGAARAVEAGAHALSTPFSMSETHSLKNVRKSHAAMLEEIGRIAAIAKQGRAHFAVGLSTAFGCTMEGAVPEDQVVRLAEASVEAGARELSLSDTTGYADPAQVKRLVRRVRAAVGDKLTTLHLHNTRGLGLANALAGLEEGITTLDASLGGLGGCPFAPGASGNIVTEDLVFMLEAMGLRTGIDLDALLKVRAIVAAALPGEPLYGFTPDAGLPLDMPRRLAVSAPAPLAGLRVVEFTHMVMGPAAGAILASLGAEVTRVEAPEGGDHTRRLIGSGSGYFPMYNRHKASVFLDLKSKAGLGEAKGLVRAADILIENFRPGALDRLGLGYEALAETNSGLIYCSLKGFLPGPYAHRTALDEVAQMMGGLAYMTGPPGRPLRAGSSVIDVTGGMFGVIAILAAIEERHRTGRGQKVQAALFETTAYLVGQHMAQMAVTGQAAAPMPARISAWAIYDVFETRDHPVFVGVVSDAQWETFCRLFGLDALWADESLRRNNDRVRARDRLLPVIRALIGMLTRDEMVAKLETSGLPFAPIARPEDLFDDPHLTASGGLEPVTLPGGAVTALPTLPIELNGARPGGPSVLPVPDAPMSGQ